MATHAARDRCSERLRRLSQSGLDTESIQYEAIAELRRVIGFDRWCWPLADPQTLVPLSGVAEHDYGPALGRSLDLEYSGSDVATMDEVARRTIPATSLSAETGDDLGRSPRWDEILRPVGIGDEAVLACRDALGCWGWIKAYRDSRDPSFGEADVDLLARAGPHLGAALRRRTRTTPPTETAAGRGSGVIVLDQALHPVSWTPAARSWIEALPLARTFASWGMLPAVVYPIAARARAHRLSAPSGRSSAVERAVDGRWVKLEASLLEGEATGRTALVLGAAGPADVFDLLCRAYALTSRERQVVAALMPGRDTKVVTERLFISRHTVQDHLKSVFRKVGVSNRRELLARFGQSTGSV